MRGAQHDLALEQIALDRRTSDIAQGANFVLPQTPYTKGHVREHRMSTRGWQKNKVRAQRADSWLQKNGFVRKAVTVPPVTTRAQEPGVAKMLQRCHITLFFAVVVCLLLFAGALLLRYRARGASLQTCIVEQPVSRLHMGEHKIYPEVRELREQLREEQANVEQARRLVSRLEEQVKEADRKCHNPSATCADCEMIATDIRQHDQPSNEHREGGESASSARWNGAGTCPMICATKCATKCTPHCTREARPPPRPAAAGLATLSLVISGLSRLVPLIVF